MKFVIENKKSGMVWEEAEDDKYQLSEWVNADSQLWNMEPQGKAGYYKIRNVGSGYVVILYCYFNPYFRAYHLVKNLTLIYTVRLIENVP